MAKKGTGKKDRKRARMTGIGNGDIEVQKDWRVGWNRDWNEGTKRDWRKVREYWRRK